MGLRQECRLPPLSGGALCLGELTLRLDVRQGVCTEAAVYTDAMDTGFARPLEVALCGSRLDTQALCRRVRGVKECAPYAADICRMLREQNI